MCSMSLSCDNYIENVHRGLRSMLETAAIADVTLAVDGLQIKAHKVILSIMSSYFRELFEANPCKHPIVIMKDVSYAVMKDLLTFIYEGKVQIHIENFQSFIATARALRVNGLDNVQKTEESIVDTKPCKRALEPDEMDDKQEETQEEDGHIDKKLKDNSEDLSQSDAQSDLDLRVDDMDETVSLNGMLIEDAVLLHPAADGTLTLDLDSDEESDDANEEQEQEQEQEEQEELQQKHTFNADRSFTESQPMLTVERPLNKQQNGMPVTLNACRTLGAIGLHGFVGLTVNGYRYNRNNRKRIQPDAAYTTWRCSNNMCGARAVITDDRRIIFVRPHTHEPTWYVCRNKQHEHLQLVYAKLPLEQWQAVPHLHEAHASKRVAGNARAD